MKNLQISGIFQYLLMRQIFAISFLERIYTVLNFRIVGKFDDKNRNLKSENR